MRPIFTGLAPTIEKEDVIVALKTLLQPWTWRRRDIIKTFEEEVRRFFHADHALTFDSGRTCLTAILRALELKENDEVLLQAYTCVAVPNPICWCRARPIYVDCDRETLNMSPEDLRRKITDRSRVLIIQHTFGQPAPLTELLAIAREYQLFVIEDCAHALGARYDGQLVGTFGDASFFSFGRDKVLSSVFGGMVVLPDSRLFSAIKEYRDTLPEPALVWILQQLLHPLLTFVAKQTYHLGLGKILLAFGRKTRLLSLPVQPCEKEGLPPTFVFHRYSGALAQLARHQWKKRERLHRHRRECAEEYMEALKQIPSLRLPITSPQHDPAWLRYTVQTVQADTLRAAAKREGIYLGDWYTTPIAPQGVNYERICYDTCPLAERAARETINLPTDIHISSHDIRRIIELIQRTI